MPDHTDMKDWGPWVPWGKRRPPDGLGDKRFQAVYINLNGDVMNDKLSNNDRHTKHHIWFTDGRPEAVTLAYRIEQ